MSKLTELNKACKSIQEFSESKLSKKKSNMVKSMINDSDKITMSLAGQEKIISGEKAKSMIDIHNLHVNKRDNSLQNASLHIFLPYKIMKEL